MTTAYMKKDADGRWWTEVRDSDKNLIRVIPTPKESIRPERTSLLYSSNDDKMKLKPTREILLNRILKAKRPYLLAKHRQALREYDEKAKETK